MFFSWLMERQSMSSRDWIDGNYSNSRIMSSWEILKDWYHNKLAWKMAFALAKASTRRKIFRFYYLVWVINTQILRRVLWQLFSLVFIAEFECLWLKFSVYNRTFITVHWCTPLRSALRTVCTFSYESLRKICFINI